MTPQPKTTTTARRRLATAITFGGLALVAACSGDGGGDRSVTGSYTHPEEGTIVVDGDGHATLDQSGVVTEMQWTVDDTTVTFAIEDGPSIKATLEGEDLVFEPGAFSGDEAERFEKS